MRKFLLLAFLTLALYPLMAQQDLSAQLMRHTWQSNRSNPALLPESKFVVGLPGFYNNLLITNITYGDLTFSDQDGKRVLNFDQAITKLGEDNLVRENLSVETLSFGVHLGDFFVSIGHAVRYNAYLNYPKTLPQLIWQGNAQFIGQTVDFGFDEQIFGYSEISVGAAYSFKDILTIGGRAKFLNGISDVSTERSDLSLFTDDDIYQLELDADFLINSAGGNLSYNGFDDLRFNFDFGNFKADQVFTSNTGFAFDIGILLKLGKLDIAASATDIGRIDWDTDVNNYSLNGQFEFQGLDVAQDILSDSSSFGSTLDTLQEIYEVVESNIGYSTTIPTRYYLSAGYQLNDMWRFGGVFFNENYRDQNFTGVALGANAQINKFINLGMLYGFRNETYNNIGVNAAVTLGPVQVVAATDNILTAFRLNDSNTANVRLGVNLLFGTAGPVDVNNISDQERFFK